VAGQYESRSTGTLRADHVSLFLLNPGRDSAFLKIVEIEMGSFSSISKPIYIWSGSSAPGLKYKYGKINAFYISSRKLDHL